MFGRSDKYRKEDIVTIQDEPFFMTDKSLVTSRVHKSIIRKILDDYGNLLNLESGVWQAGEQKTPRYEDMFTYMKNFKNEYHPKRIDWNFYNYIKNDSKIDINEINRMFFKLMRI